MGVFLKARDNPAASERRAASPLDSPDDGDALALTVARPRAHEDAEEVTVTREPVPGPAVGVG